MRYNTEYASGDSDFEKPFFGEKYLVLREGILSRKNLASGSWLWAKKRCNSKKRLKFIDSKFGSGAVLNQLNLYEEFSK